MQKIRIDFDNPGLPQHISAVENDSQSRFFQATLYENGKAYSAPEGATYSIMYSGFGPQNQGWYDTINDGAGKRAACAVSGNVVTCEIARQALQVPGHVSIVLCVTTGKGYMLKSWPIECDCKNDRYDSTAEIQSFFYITQVSNADWNRAIQALEELKNTIDPTLSLSGKAADAKVTGDAVGQLKEDLAYLEGDNVLGLINNRVKLNNFVDKEIGGIDTSTGQNVPVSSSSNRIRTNLLNIKNAVVNPIDGYVVFAFYYNVDGSFDHYGGIISNNHRMENGYMFRFTARKTDSSTITNQDLLTDMFDIIVDTNIYADNIQIDNLAFVEKSNNLFNIDDNDIIAGKYINPNGNILDSSTGTLSISGYIPVSSGSTYSFGSDEENFARTLCAFDAKGNVKESAGSSNNISTYTVPDGVSKIRVSYYNTSDTTFRVNKSETLLPWDEYGKTVIPRKYLDVDTPLTKNSYIRKIGNVSNGDTWELEENNIKTGNLISFIGTISSFDSIDIGHGTGCDYVSIDGTNIKHYRNGLLSSTIPHGLTIENNIAITIRVGDSAEYKAFITLVSNGKTFNTSFTGWLGNQQTIFVRSTNSTLTDCVFSFTCNHYNSNVYAFGDSYFGHASDNRWVYYLLRDGYTKNLLDGFGGRTSVKALESLKTDLKHGTPKYIFWALGMNDLESGGMNTTWKSCVEEVMDICKENGIELVLATIPNTPTMTNTYKNEYVRNSGYRYVDFAKSVGAEESGSTWYGNMLSSDNVHPNADGAIMLYHQMLCDLPEITLDN